MDYTLIMAVLNIAHYILIPFGVIVCLRELFPTLAWAQIPLTFNAWVSMAVLLYVLKLI
jgi:hypothetical protein